MSLKKKIFLSQESDMAFFFLLPFLTAVYQVVDLAGGREKSERV